MFKTIIHQIILLSFITIAYLIGIQNMQNPFLLATSVLSIILFVIRPVLNFIFLFILYVDPFNLYIFNMPRALPLVLILLYTLLHFKNLKKLIGKDVMFQRILQISLVFFIYQIVVSFIYHNFEFGFNEAFRSIGYFLGFFILIPAYYFTITARKTIFHSIVIISVIILTLFTISYYSDIKIVNIQYSMRFAGEDIERVIVGGYKQFTKFFIFLLPFIFLFKINKFSKSVLYFIGIISSLIIILGMYRMEMFYTFSGVLILIFISSKTFRLKRVFLTIAFSFIGGIILLNLLFPAFYSNIERTYTKTQEYFSGETDEVSAETREAVELPSLLNLIQENPFLGNGIFTLRNENIGHWGFVDIPFLGTLAAYGILGMLLYYLKFVFIFKKMGRFRLLIKHNYHLVTNDYTNETLIILALLAYFITMISTRLFYISFELTNQGILSEFGFFAGIFFGLIRLVELNVEQKKLKPIE